ncbi:hypothetical protein B0H66DRAFT_553748 [Apodospora peruviana]|uniref:Peroxin 11C n=1 Tax=Apodospora peruviana TaxID=516989 RepID=A0AAE0IDC3_9PEZI|nr:hypothetical protein B0H66DRAFT_553748 [Apodospora peruviana]
MADAQVETTTATDIIVPVVADLPSGDPIPPSSSVALPPNPSKPAAAAAKPLPLRQFLSATPSNIDAFLARLNKCLSTPSGLDTVLLLVCYTSKFSATILGHLARSVLRRSAREWISLLASVSAKTNTTVVATTNLPATASTAAAASALVLAKRLNALSELTSEARTISRLWALVGMYFWGKGVFAKLLAKRRNGSSTTTKELSAEKAEEKAEESTRLETIISLTQLTLCVALQTLENGAYLSSKGVMGWSPATQGWAYKWSVRFWAAFVGIEIGKLAAEGFASPPAAGSSKALSTGEKTAEWRGKLARNLAWAPLTLHWSIDGGLPVVNEAVVGFLGSIPGIIQMRELWASTA